MGEGGRRYTEEEFALILRKAAERQDGSGQAPSPGGGFTLGEMQSIADEVGIAPAAIERAAQALDRPTPGLLARVLGGPTRIRLDATVPGVLAESSFPSVVDGIRRAADAQGNLRHELGGLEWRAATDLTQLSVTVRPEPQEGLTRVALAGDLGGVNALSTALPIIGSLIGAGIVGAIVEPSTVAGGVGLISGMFAGGLLTAHGIWRSTSRRLNARFRGILERVRTQVEDEVGGEDHHDG